MDCAEEQQQQPIFKHYCRICKKGFMCGRALGGHMRAHGIGDENANLDDDDGASDWEDPRSSSSTTRRMYQLRTNPNRLKSCRVCENCGKEFSSWKSFLEHGKCSSEDAESLVSSPGSDGDYEEGERRGGGCQQWSKRKRSLRTKVGSYCSSANPNPNPNSYNNNSSCDQDEDDLLLAKCLVELANTDVEAEPDQESCASASRDEAAASRRIPVNAYFNQYPSFSNRYPSYSKPTTNSSNNKGGLFECKACKKVFNSHQALGGHRASHKKVKGCYAAKQDQIMDDIATPADEDVISHDEFFPNSSKSLSFQYDQGSSRSKSKVHECTICHRVFSTGQALGGHKRCHWITTNTQEPNNSPIVKLHFPDHMDHEQANAQKSRRVLDLNIPANHGDHSSALKRGEPQNLLSLEVSTDIHLHTWANLEPETKCDQGHHEKVNKNLDQHAASNGGLMIESADNDEADSNKVRKLGKLSDLSNSSQWLQVGIGTTSAADHHVTSQI